MALEAERNRDAAQRRAQEAAVVHEVARKRAEDKAHTWKEEASEARAAAASEVAAAAERAAAAARQDAERLAEEAMNDMKTKLEEELRANVNEEIEENAKTLALGMARSLAEEDIQAREEARSRDMETRLKAMRQVMS